MEKVDRSGDSASAKPLDTRIALSEEAWQRDQVYVAPANTGEISVALAPEPKTFQPGSGVTLSRTTNDTGLGVSGLVARGADGDTGPSLTTTVYRPGRDPHLNAHEMSYVVNPDHDKNHPPIFSPSFNPPVHRGEPPPNAFPPKITLPDGQVYGGLPVPGQDRPGLPDVPWTGGRGSGTDNGGLNSPGLYPGLLPGGGLNPIIEPGSKLPPGNGGEVPGLQPGNNVPGVTVIPGNGGYFPPPKEKPAGTESGPAGTEIPPSKTPVFPGPSGSDNPLVTVPPVATRPKEKPVGTQTGPAGSDNPPVTVPPVATPPISIPQGGIPPKEKPAGTGSGTQIDVPPVQPPVKTPALPVPSGSDNQPAGNKTPVLPRPEVISVGGQVGPKTSSELPPVVVKRPGDVPPPVVSRPSETIAPVVVKPVLPTLPSKGESVIVTQGKPVEAIPPVLKPAQPSDTKPVVVRAPEVTAKPAIKAIDTTVSWKDVAKSSLPIARTLETARSAEKAPVVKDVPASAIRVPQKFADAVAVMRADKVVPVKQPEVAAARLPEKFVAAVTAIRAEKVVQKSIVKQEAATPLPQKFTVGNLAAIKAARILPAKETTVAEKQTAKTLVAPAALVRAPHLVVPGKDALSGARKPATTADSLLTAKTDRTVSQQKPLPTIDKTKSAHTAAPKDFVVKDYAMLQNGLLGKLLQADKTNVRPEGKQQEVTRLHIATKPVADVVVSKALPGRKDAAAGRVEPVDAHRAMRDNLRVLLHEHKHAQTENISRTPATPVSTVKALSLSDTPSQSFSVRFKNDAGETEHRPTRLDLLMAVLAAASAVSRAGRLERQGKKRRLFNESVNEDEVLPSLTIASEILARLNADDTDDDTVDLFGNEGQAARIVRRRYIVQPGDSLNSIAGDQLGDEVLAWLLLEINVGAIQHQWSGNICVAEMVGRQEIELPTPEEVAEFYKTRPARRFRDKRLVSSVKQTEMDRELVFETFSRVIGRRADEQPA